MTILCDISVRAIINCTNCETPPPCIRIMKIVEAGLPYGFELNTPFSLQRSSLDSIQTDMIPATTKIYYHHRPVYTTHSNTPSFLNWVKPKSNDQFFFGGERIYFLKAFEVKIPLRNMEQIF